MQGSRLGGELGPAPVLAFPLSASLPHIFNMGRIYFASLDPQMRNNYVDQVLSWKKRLLYWLEPGSSWHQFHFLCDLGQDLMQRMQEFLFQKVCGVAVNGNMAR